MFDFDGVIIDNEKQWVKEKDIIFSSLFGNKIAHILSHTTGQDMNSIYGQAVKLGAQASKDSFIKSIYGSATKIYSTSAITKDLSLLIDWLNKNNITIGIVSASPIEWIKTTLDRLPFEHSFSYILSLNGSSELKHKPNPDGYLKAMRDLKVNPFQTMILEDSLSGIKAAKASGALTIAFTANNPLPLQQSISDFKVNSMKEVLNILSLLS